MFRQGGEGLISGNPMSREGLRDMGHATDEEGNWVSSPPGLNKTAAGAQCSVAEAIDTLLASRNTPDDFRASFIEFFSAPVLAAT